MKPAFPEPPQLPPRQRQALEFIGRHIRARGFAPSTREIAAGLGVKSPNAALDHVRALRRKGLLEPGTQTARDLVLTPLGWSCLPAIPLLHSLYRRASPEAPGLYLVEEQDRCRLATWHDHQLVWADGSRRAPHHGAHFYFLRAL